MGQYLQDLPDICTERLHLRPLRVVDAEAFRVMTDEPSILAVINFLAHPFTLADAEKLLDGDGDGRDCFWGAYLRAESTLIGTVGTHLRGGAEIEIGYWFGVAARGRGLATEAVAGIVAILSRTFPERRLVAECRPQNEASWRLLEGAGFRADGADGARPGRKRLAFEA